MRRPYQIKGTVTVTTVTVTVTVTKFRREQQLKVMDSTFVAQEY